MSNFVGIDPGRKGAIAQICASGLIKVTPMPPEFERGIDLHSLPDLQPYTQGRLDRYIVAIEWNTSRPGEVPDYAFRFGLQTGQLDAWYKAKGYAVKHISPQKWKGYFGLPGKQADPASEQGAALWCRLYPSYSGLIYGPRGGIQDGPLDALLIAEYLRQTESSPVGTKGGRRPPKIIGLTKEELQ